MVHEGRKRPDKLQINLSAARTLKGDRSISRQNNNSNPANNSNPELCFVSANPMFLVENEAV